MRALAAAMWGHARPRGGLKNGARAPTRARSVSSAPRRQARKSIVPTHRSPDDAQKASLLGRWHAHLTGIERAALALPLLLGGSIWIFLAVAGAVVGQDARSFDKSVLLAMRNPLDVTQPWGPGWLQEMARDFTALGGVAVLTLLALATIGYLVMLRKHHAAIAVAIAIGGGSLLSTVLKWYFDRDRPDLVPHGSIVYTASFPSGHSMMAAVTYLTLGALLARIHAPLRIKAYLLGCAILLTLLVGVSRVYLGVHWPSDVAAGWAVGAAWALMASLAVRALQWRGTVETPVRTRVPPPGGQAG
jgi:undecaprenyl-diphosphatase